MCFQHEIPEIHLMINMQVVSLWNQQGTNMGPMWKSFVSQIMKITWYQYEFHKGIYKKPIWFPWYEIHTVHIWHPDGTHVKFMKNSCGIHMN